MDNNDILIRLRYALDIKDLDMIEIFKLGGTDFNKEELLKILTKTQAKEEGNKDSNIPCTNAMLESFLNGFIIFKRGRQEPKPGHTKKPPLAIKSQENINNIVMKKLKIALSLTSDDIHEILEAAGVSLSRSELSAIFRKEGHRNYVVCGDSYVRNFLKGLTLRYRI